MPGEETEPDGGVPGTARASTAGTGAHSVRVPSAGSTPQSPAAGRSRSAAERSGPAEDDRSPGDTERTEFTLDDVSVVMGTYDEEAAVGTVLSDVNAATDGRAEVVCVDGSSDRTPEIARDHGARVIEQEPRGYGVAVAAALDAASRPVVVTVDCDDTYPVERIPEFLALVNRGYDVVSGDRLYHGADAMPRVNRLGNRAFALLASVAAGDRVRDSTTGMRAYRRSVLESIEWTENTGLSAELLIRPLARGYDVREEPIEYDDRLGETTLDPLRGGAAIAASILRVGVEERLW